MLRTIFVLMRNGTFPRNCVLDFFWGSVLGQEPSQTAPGPPWKPSGTVPRAPHAKTTTPKPPAAPGASVLWPDGLGARAQRLTLDARWPDQGQGDSRASLPSGVPTHVVRCQDRRRNRRHDRG